MSAVLSLAIANPQSQSNGKVVRQDSFNTPGASTSTDIVVDPSATEGITEATESASLEDNQTPMGNETELMTTLKNEPTPVTVVPATTKFPDLGAATSVRDPGFGVLVVGLLGMTWGFLML